MLSILPGPIGGSKSPGKALEIVEEVAGSQLDARMVDVFKKVYVEDMIHKEKGSS